MTVVTLTVNDELISANAGQTVLEAVRDSGGNIPTMCHLDGLSNYGGCRLCLIELGGSPKLSPACFTQVQEGMVVFTHTDRLIKYRKMVIELLLSERNHICAVCVMNGNCELQAMAAELGVDNVRYDYLSPKLAMDASHELFTLDHNRCILCRRCMRACDEIEGSHVWDISGRGIDSMVITGLNMPWGESDVCTKCGKCVQVCPTGALSKKGSSVAEMKKDPVCLRWVLDGRQKGIWDYEKRATRLAQV
ncbi:MAG: bidirectional hydrogenase complex protein HoxU [Anaerolineaceae bacterium 4572_78]|nr:MAG: bidirectional hydrogenase complex protein HoxU [Anaerolineaceae bacterium 4572_78]